MRNLQGTAGALRDREGFVDGVQELVILVAHVGCVREPTPRERPTQRDEFVQRREGARRVLETSRGTTGAVGERALHHCSHATEFVGRRRPVGLTDDGGANAPQADHGGHVGTRTQPIDSREVRREGSFLAAVGARTTIGTNDDRSHTLTDHRFVARILGEISIAVGMNVDETRRDGEAARVDLIATARGEPRANRRDASRRDCEIEHLTFGARAVEKGSAPDDEVVVGSARECVRQDSGREQCGSGRREK